VTTALRWLAFLSGSALIGLALTVGLTTVDSPRDRFIDHYQQQHGPMTYTELQLPTIGQMNCDSLESGYSLPDVYTDNLVTGLSGDQAAFTIEAAIAVFCPQFSSLLEEE
jgi:hypothetical protein